MDVGSHARALAFRTACRQVVPTTRRSASPNWYKPGFSRTYLDRRPGPAPHFAGPTAAPAQGQSQDQGAGGRLDPGRLRNRRFFSLTELNQAIGELVADLNAPMTPGRQPPRSVSGHHRPPRR
jgi:hypothetical protein